jgi:glyoxylase-like metal-dependent hydrolase (beta-lactamase superfamily II)
VNTGVRGRCFATLLWLCSAAWAQAPQPSAAGCEQVTAVPWQAVAPGVWAWAPQQAAEVSVANAGHVAPTTVLVQGAQALVIDPGPSHAHAWRVRESLRCRFQARVGWVVNTHAHAENVLGNSAFADGVAAGTVEILASAATREAMQQRCPACLASLSARVGEAAMAGTQIVLPGRTLAAGEVLRVGRRELRVMRVEQGHTEGDLVLWDAAERVLWAGGLAYQDRVPELAQGRLDDWLAALERLLALRPAVVVSAVVSRATEPQGVPAALLATRSYLRALRAGILQAMDAGRQPQDTEVVDLPAFRHWAGYAERHGFNVQRAWRELEPVWMEQGASPPGPGSAQGVGR